MPQIAALALHNGTAAVTFAPSKHTWENGYQVVEYLQNTAGVSAILRAKVRIEIKQPQSGRAGKLKFSVTVPTQETISGTSDQGYVAPARVAFRDAVRVEYDIPERSSSASRAILQAYVNRLINQGTALVVGDPYLTGITVPNANSVVSAVYQTVEGMY